MAKTFAKAKAHAAVGFLVPMSPKPKTLRPTKEKEPDAYDRYAAMCIEDLAFGPNKKMTQEQLAAKSGVTGSTLSGVRAFVKGAGSKTQKGLAIAMGIPLSDWQRNAERTFGVATVDADRMPANLATLLDRRKKEGRPISAQALANTLNQRNLSGFSMFSEADWDEIVDGYERAEARGQRVNDDVTRRARTDQSDLDALGPKSKKPKK